MSKTIVIVIAVIAALLPVAAIVVCAALIALGLAPPLIARLRALPARRSSQSVSLLALALFRAPPALPA